MTQVHSFPPIAAPDATRLILGTMPSVASLEASRYYAHKRNGFWPLIDAVLALPTGLDYSQRCEELLRHKIALWDVLQCCTRPGSLDAAIVATTMIPNNFKTFLQQHPAITDIYFNGQQAAHIWRRLVQPQLRVEQQFTLHVLPSSSPANAAMSFAVKLQQWRALNL